MLVQFITGIVALVLVYVFTRPNCSTNDFCVTILKSGNRFSQENEMQCEARVRHHDIGDRIKAACLSGTFSTSPAKISWQRFKAKFKKTYADADEELYRCLSFQDSLRQVELHNARFEAGTESYYLKITPAADLTDKELRDKYLGGGAIAYEDIVKSYVSNETKLGGELPDERDWSKLGYVTDSIDQKACGSCWAFSAVGVIESQYFKKHGTLKRLSVQQLVDCNYNRSGCVGGWTDSAYLFVQHYGITTEKLYPYTGKYGECKYNKSMVVTRIKRFHVLPPRDEERMKLAVGTVGPLSVTYFMPTQMRLYGGGIYDAKHCPDNKQKINHGVVLVGYGVTDKKVKYWLIKNSMGRDWGENGYFKIPFGENYCSIAAFTSYAEL